MPSERDSWKDMRICVNDFTTYSLVFNCPLRQQSKYAYETLRSSPVGNHQESFAEEVLFYT